MLTPDMRTSRFYSMFQIFDSSSPLLFPAPKNTVTVAALNDVYPMWNTTKFLSRALQPQRYLNGMELKGGQQTFTHTLLSQ